MGTKDFLISGLGRPKEVDFWGALAHRLVKLNEFLLKGSNLIKTNNKAALPYVENKNPKYKT